MNVTGIIAEYNPLHKGHLYQIEKAREETSADYIVVVMSGDYVQRGAPAIIDKYTRTEMALKAGADLVIELPLYYSISSAELFSMGAVSLLDRLGCVNALCFGSECEEISDLIGIASRSLNESDEYKSLLSEYQKQGKSYAQASALALHDTCPDENLKEKILEITHGPNNSLGIAYIKSLLKRESTIRPYCIKRIDGDYNDESEGVLSASSVRKGLERSNSLDGIKMQLPDFTYEAMQKAYHRSFPITENDFSQFMIYRLRNLQFEKNMLGLKSSETNYVMSSFVDVSKSLARRIDSALNQYENHRQFCNLIKTRQMTYSYVSRGLFHILLNMKKNRLEQYIRNDYVYYARILGFKRDSSYLLTMIKDRGDIPLISKLADARNLIKENGRQMLESDIYAANLYEQISCMKFNHQFIPELSKSIIRL